MVAKYKRHNTIFPRRPTTIRSGNMAGKISWTCYNLQREDNVNQTEKLAAIHMHV